MMLSSLINTADFFFFFLNIAAHFQVFWSFHKVSINILQMFNKFNQSVIQQYKISRIFSPERQNWFNTNRKKYHYNKSLHAIQLPLLFFFFFFQALITCLCDFEIPLYFTFHWAVNKLFHPFISLKYIA